MPKTAKQTTATLSPNPDSVLILDTLLIDDETGAELRLKASANEIEEHVRIYHMNLSSARDIPPEGDLPTGDPVVLYLLEELYGSKPPKDEKENEERLSFVTKQTQMYYGMHRENIAGEATVLAISVENEFSHTPRPYPESKRQKLPGTIDMPDITKDLKYPSEYRLKQLIDYLDDNKDLKRKFLQLQSEIQSRITVTLINSASQAGFLEK